MKTLFYTIWAFLLFSIVGVVFAQDLILTRIGALSTIGSDYSYVVYTGAIPTLQGTASPSAVVNIKIKTSTDATVAASPSGAWQFTPGVLDKGISAVQVSSGLESLSFVIEYNATPAATPTATLTATPVPDQLPTAGVWEYYLPIIGMGLTVFFFGNFLKKKMLSWEGKKHN